MPKSITDRRSVCLWPGLYPPPSPRARESHTFGGAVVPIDSSGEIMSESSEHLEHNGNPAGDHDECGASVFEGRFIGPGTEVGKPGLDRHDAGLRYFYVH